MTMVQDSTDETGVSDDSERGGSGVAAARMRKARAALESKREGWTWDEIAETWGYPTARAAKVAAEKAMEAGLLDVESQEFMRKMASARLEALLKKVWEVAHDDENPGQVAAVRECRMLVMDHSKLMGYIAPQELAIYSPMASEIEKFVGLVRQQNAGPVLEESDIFGDDGEAFELVEGPDGVFTKSESD